MPYTPVQGVAEFTTVLTTITFDSPITPGNAIFIFVSDMQKVGNPPNPYIGPDVLNFLPNSAPTALIWKTNCTGGGTVVTWPNDGMGNYWTSGFGASIIGMEVSGVPATLVQDLQQTPDTFSIDTQFNNEVIIAAFISDNPGMTLGSPGTPSPVPYSDVYGDSGVIGVLAAPTIGTYTFNPVYTGFAQMWAFGFYDPLPSGTLTVAKATVPAGSSQVFTFTPSWGSSFTLTDGNSATFGLDPGTYSVVETPVAGWGTTTDKDPSAIVVNSNQDTRITFTNTAPTYAVTELPVQDSLALDSNVPTWENTLGTPYTTDESLPPIPAINLSYQPQDDGWVDLIYTPVPNTLSNTGVPLSFPPDFSIPVLYRALQILYSIQGEGADDQRAQYCGERYEMLVAMSKSMAFMGRQKSGRSIRIRR